MRSWTLEVHRYAAHEPRNGCASVKRLSRVRRPATMSAHTRSQSAAWALLQQHGAGMTRSELLAALATRMPQLSMRDSEAAVRAVFEAMTQALVKGHRIEIRGFGTFALRHRGSRLGRNPRTGEALEVSSKRTVHFKPGKSLRECVEQQAGRSMHRLVAAPVPTTQAA